MIEFTDEMFFYLVNKHRNYLIADIEKLLCLEHYNHLNKTSCTEKDIKLKPTECWVCKAIKDRP